MSWMKREKRGKGKRKKDRRKETKIARIWDK